MIGTDTHSCIILQDGATSRDPGVITGNADMQSAECSDEDGPTITTRYSLDGWPLEGLVRSDRCILPPSWHKPTENRPIRLHETCSNSCRTPQDLFECETPSDTIAHGRCVASRNARSDWLAPMGKSP